MPEANFESSQFLPKETEEEVKQSTNPVVKSQDEHGIQTKAPTQQGKQSMPTSQPTSKPVVASASAAKTSTQTLPVGKVAVIEFSSETDNVMGVIIFVRRNDGIILQFPLSFIEKQDLYNTKNMFDLIGKCLTLSPKDLEENYPTFVKG